MSAVQVVKQESDFDKEKLVTRSVHLGFGAFTRAHQLLYTDELLQKTQGDWGICAVNLYGGESLIEALRKQQHNYLVAEKGADLITLKRSRSITESLHLELDGGEAVLEKMAEPQVAIISMTVTEKGYCADPATGLLDESNSLIIADVKSPAQPKSAAGFIVQALKVRRERGLQPFTVMSCDNIQCNGKVAKAVVVGLAKLQDPELAVWIEENVSFPCTMVDRIVPAATDETLAEIQELNDGVFDPCAIACEPFRQWVIEDNFVAGRPDWNLAGAEFVEDVIPFEEMKLRMLNGSHSFLAYLGYLGGYKHISDTMGDEFYKAAAHDLMVNCQAPSLDMPEDTDLGAYAELLINRYCNPAIKHQTWQIAMDGSQKIPQRLGGSVQYHLDNGSDFTLIALAIAAWMRYVSGSDEQGNAIDVRDPMSEKLRAVCDENGYTDATVKALLAIDSIFPPAIGSNEKLIEAVTAQYASLVKNGAKQTVKTLMELRA